MAPTTNYLPITDITPQTKRDWTVKVVVLEKSYPRTPMRSPKKFQRLILADKEGTRVQATIFGVDIALFANTLHVMHKYEISNATVTPVDIQYRIVPHQYQWIINRRTLVRELMLNKEDDIKVPLNLVRFPDLPKYIGNHYKRTSTKYLTKEHHGYIVQVFIILNEELKPTMLTMWDQFIPNEALYILDHIDEWPIILAMRLKVGSYNELSLSTKSSSTFLINPELPKAVVLRSWAIENQTIIREIVNKKQYVSIATTSTSKVPSDMTKIVDIPAMPKEGATFKVQARSSICNTKQRFIYMCCNNCQRSIDAKHEATFSCLYCNKLATATPRCCVEIQLEDSSGTIVATIFGQKAENLFSLIAMDLLQHKKEDDTIDVEYLNTTTSDKDHIFILKASHREYRQEVKVMFVVLSDSDLTKNVQK